MYLGHVKVLLGMFLSLKTLYRKRTVIWPFYFYTIIRTLSHKVVYHLKFPPIIKYIMSHFLQYVLIYILP
ncbi:hypothetical protein CXZ04_09240 [Staphylococcus aureus]|nr:hypothetical protein CXZ04_09240 [Staphylococcus aureus]